MYCEVGEMEKKMYWFFGSTYYLPVYPLATLFILEQFCGNYPSLEYFTNFTVVYQYNVFANYHRIDMPYDKNHFRVVIIKRHEVV